VEFGDYPAFLTAVEIVPGESRLFIIIVWWRYDIVEDKIGGLGSAAAAIATSNNELQSQTKQQPGLCTFWSNKPLRQLN
jgi:hypothetical protein